MTTQRCGAKTRKTGEPCQQWALRNGRCRFHGGKTPFGPALPQYKTGRFSKYLPERLQEYAAAALADTDLLSMRDGIALLDARLTELLQGTTNTAVTWKTAHAELQAFTRAETPEQARTHLTLLRQAIESGLTDAAKWHDIQLTLENRRKLTESEHKRLVAMQQMIPAEQAMGFATALIHLVAEHVQDPTAKRNIIDGAYRLMSKKEIEA
jgi:hypothetical protein